ncbi:LysR family transcriptional regulator [Shinella fusca]|uniref:DNA-binding transcriptional LysR family regulator n=1 Tax=Shinella fusca TaxID=544480 RepID=A0A7W8DT88_9HYPH|nr:LysR family transcriptional regulator [Shinella fusca]MBB5041180.1 DNA-binding transcriptional LysR family regulator [Shinella fusca]
MHPRQLKTFLAVARCGNITRAAAEVHLAQSSVSDQIQALEAEMETALFHRARSGITLTEAGRAFLPFAERLVLIGEEARIAVRQASGIAADTLSIGTLETIAASKLAMLLPKFAATHPDIAIRVTVASSGELSRQLAAGDLDLALSFFGPGADDRFKSRKVADEPLVLIAPASCHDGGGGFDRLAREAFIATARGCTYRRMFEEGFEAAGFASPTPAAEVASIGAIVQMVAAGGGLALVPRLALAGNAGADRVTELEWPRADAAAPLHLFWRHGTVRRRAIAAFLDFARTGLRSADARLRHAAPSPS